MDVGLILRGPPVADASERPRQRFTYDGLHRLQTATGTWTEPGGKTNRYSGDLDYDLIHNLTRKDQDHVVETRGGSEVVQRETTYDWAYTYVLTAELTS